MKPVESDRLDAEERRELSSSDFGIPEERAFPMPDAAHVRAAEAYFRYASDDQKPELARNILEKAAEYGVRGVPTLAVFQNGNLLWKESGVHDVNTLTNLLQNFANQTN